MQELIADVLRDLSAPLPARLREASFRLWLLAKEPGEVVTITGAIAFGRWGRRKAEALIALPVAVAVADDLLVDGEKSEGAHTLSWVVSAKCKANGKPNPHGASLFDKNRKRVKSDGAGECGWVSASRRVKTGQGRPILLAIVKPGNSELRFLWAWDAFPPRGFPVFIRLWPTPHQS